MSFLLARCERPQAVLEHVAEEHVEEDAPRITYLVACQVVSSTVPAILVVHV